MQYTPRTQNEITAMGLLPEGIYGFEVADAKDAISKSSNKQMVALTLSVFADDGSRKSVKDYIVPGTNYGDKKLFEFCSTVGLGPRYATGAIPTEEMLGRAGMAKIGVEKGKKKDNSEEFFADKNTVRWYSTKKDAVAAAPARIEPTEAQKANLDPLADDTSVPF